MDKRPVKVTEQSRSNKSNIEEPKEAFLYFFNADLVCLNSILFFFHTLLCLNFFLFLQYYCFSVSLISLKTNISLRFYNYRHTHSYCPIFELFLVFHKNHVCNFFFFVFCRTLCMQKFNLSLKKYYVKIKTLMINNTNTNLDILNFSFFFFFFSDFQVTNLLRCQSGLIFPVMSSSK